MNDDVRETEIIEIQLTPDEKQMITRLCSSRGLNINDFIRNLIQKEYHKYDTLRKRVNKSRIKCDELHYYK